MIVTPPAKTIALPIDGKPLGSGSNNDSGELNPRQLQHIRRAIATALLLILLLVAARLWCLEGLLFPVFIEGASMADSLAGPHFRVRCSDCDYTFRCDAIHVPGSLEAACPNCGYAENRLRPEDLRTGDQVLVDHWVYLLGRPARGDVVAFTDPNDKERRIVKRIVGLPGESIEIRSGDVYANGKPVQKNLNELQQQAILVNDSQLPPRHSKNIPPQWQPAQEGGYWIERERAYHFNGKTPPYEFAWLSFRYFRRHTAPLPHTKFSPVLDFDAYNAADNRELNDVADVLLTCRASIAKFGCLVFAAVDGADRFEVHLCHDEQKLKLLQNGQEIKVELLPHRNHDEPIDIQFALCDQRVLFGMDGRQVLAVPYTRQEPGTQQLEPQLQIGAAGARIRISHPRVYRDIYYLDPSDTAAPWSVDGPVPPHHFLVLGDNPPASDDSRQWVPAAIPRSAIFGRVIRPWWAGR